MRQIPDELRAGLAPAAETAIAAVVCDYFEGWFDGDARRMVRALHPGLAKRSLEDGRLETITAAEMVDATARGVGRRRDPDERRLEIVVDDVHGPIANVTVRGAIYREYLQLVRTPAGWRIANALWERA